MRSALAAIFLFFAVSAFARIWTTKDGSMFEGDVYKCTSVKLTVLDSKNKRTVVEIKELSDDDVAYLKRTYPEFFTAEGSRSEEDESKIEASPAYLKWPVISIKHEDVGFRWDTKRGRFYTRHYRFDMRKKIPRETALELALRCETAYESVRLLPFWPDKFKRLAAVDKNGNRLKFSITIDNIKGSSVAGVYRASYNAKGEIIEETVTVEPKQLSTSDSKRSTLSGVLAHELTHQLTCVFGGSTALKEGLAQYVQYSYFDEFMQAHFTKFEGLFKSNPKIKAEVQSLTKFLCMPQDEFLNSTRVENNYMSAFLIFTYFVLKEPDTFKKFLEKCLHEEELVHSAKNEVKDLKAALPVLYNGRKESEVENAIHNYYAQFGIQMTFKSVKIAAGRKK